MATINYPVGVLTDNAGNLLTGAATVTIASVVNPSTGVAIAGNGAAVNTACLPFVSVAYDAETYGEAVITLAVSQTGRVITGANAAPALYAAKDSSRITTALPNAALPSDTTIRADVAASTVAGVAGVTLPATVPSLAQIVAAQPTDASVQADVAAALTAQGLTTARAGYLSNIGTPQQAGTAVVLPNNAPSTFLANDASVQLILSLVGNNLALFNPTYDTSTPPNLLSGTLIAYDTAAHCTANDGTTGAVHKWALTYAPGAVSGTISGQTQAFVS